MKFCKFTPRELNLHFHLSACSRASDRVLTLANDERFIWLLWTIVWIAMARGSKPVAGSKRDACSHSGRQSILRTRADRRSRPAIQKHAAHVAAPVIANLISGGAGTTRQMSAIATRIGG